jgi:hypothetical protein
MYILCFQNKVKVQMIYMYIDLQIFITIWLGIKHTKKPNLVKPMYMYVDL